MDISALVYLTCNYWSWHTWITYYDRYGMHTTLKHLIPLLVYPGPGVSACPILWFIISTGLWDWWPLVTCMYVILYMHLCIWMSISFMVIVYMYLKQNTNLLFFSQQSLNICWNVAVSKVECKEMHVVQREKATYIVQNREGKQYRLLYLQLS
jgi:hypothetical protein